MFTNLEDISGLAAVIIAVMTYLLGNLIGYTSGSRSTARRIAMMVVMWRDISGLEAARISDEIMKQYVLPKYATQTKKGVTVALDTEMSEELYFEGMARDIVHELQNARKSLGLRYEDYIIVEWMAPIRVAETIIKYEKYIREEARVSKLIQDIGPGHPLGELVRTRFVGSGHKPITFGVKKDPTR